MKACIMEWDNEEKLYCFLQELDLASIPSKDDKVVFNIKGIGYVFNVNEVHYGDTQKVDVRVKRIATITEYDSAKKTPSVIWK